MVCNIFKYIYNIIYPIMTYIQPKLPPRFGDNYCDDENNNEACGWDGGDCCGDNVNTQFCSACECLDPNGGDDGTTDPPTEPPTEPPTQPPIGECEYPGWFGDNYCDDGNNNEECGWDGGDCCGDNVNTQYCSVCEYLIYDQLFPCLKRDQKTKNVRVFLTACPMLKF